MVVFGLVGGFLIKAAIDYSPNQAVGLDGALAKLANASYGPFLLGIVAAGLIAFGIYSLCDRPLPPPLVAPRRIARTAKLKRRNDGRWDSADAGRGAKKEQYVQVNEGNVRGQSSPRQDQLPEGLIIHTAGPSEDGWYVYDVWESREAFERFMDGKLGPAIRQVFGDQPPPPGSGAAILRGRIASSLRADRRSIQSRFSTRPRV